MKIKKFYTLFYLCVKTALIIPAALIHTTLFNFFVIAELYTNLQSLITLINLLSPPAFINLSFDLNLSYVRVLRYLSISLIFSFVKTEERMTSAYHPQLYGLCNRQNSTIKDLLVKGLDKTPTKSLYIIKEMLFLDHFITYFDEILQLPSLYTVT